MEKERGKLSALKWGTMYHVVRNGATTYVAAHHIIYNNFRRGSSFFVLVLMIMNVDA